MTSEENSKKSDDRIFWRNLIVRYWYILLVFGILIVAATIGGILTLNWYVSTSALGGFGTWTFDQFSLGTAIVYCLWLVLWMLLFVVLPTLAVFGLVIGISWKAILSLEMKEELKMRFKAPQAHKRSEGGGALGFFLFLGVCLFVFIDGNWLTPFGSLSIGYFIQATIIVFIWEAIIFCIPAAIIGIIWFVTKYHETA
jgi:hypothetical protein